MKVSIFKSKTYKRLERIYKYLSYSNISEKHKRDGVEQYIINFNSNLGEVRISLYFTEKEYWTFRLDYTHVMGAKVFEVVANESSFDVNPLLNEYLGGHEIDLAILEFENYLENTLGNLNELVKISEKEEQERLKRHNIELDILEHGTSKKSKKTA